MNYIILLGAFQALLTLGLLFFLNGKKSPNTITNWLLLCILLHLSNNFILITVFPNAKIHKQYFTFITLLYPALIWQYVWQLSRQRKWGRSNYFPFIPAAVAAVFYIYIAVHTIANGGNPPKMIGTYNKIVGYAILVMYPYYSVKTMLASRRVSPFWKREAKLAGLMGILFCFLFLYWILRMFLNTLFPDFAHANHAVFEWWNKAGFYLILLVLCFAIGSVKLAAYKYTHTALAPSLHTNYDDLTSPQVGGVLVKAAKNFESPVLATIFEPGVEAEEIGLEEGTSLPRKQSLSPALQAQIANGLQGLMDKEKAYTNPDITLESLATMLGVSRHQLSEYLNQHVEKSFYQYINEYRIKEVVKLMGEYRLKNANPNVLSLAFEVGFNSKSSFNQYFKKNTGRTPSEYLKNVSVTSE